MYYKKLTYVRQRCDKGSEFYNRSMESWLQDNDIDTEK